MKKRLIKTVSIVLAVGIIFTSGLHIGRQHTIHQAELIDMNDTRYLIAFGDDVHEYQHISEVVKIEFTDKGVLYIFEDGTSYYSQNFINIEEVK